MESRITTSATVAAIVAAVVTAVPSLAQDNQPHIYKHHHYKLIDLDTFGGPTSGVFIEPTGNIANAAGDVVGVADTASTTPVPDCYNPVGNPDCYVSHAFVWRGNGLRDLGTLPGGYYSFATAINRSGQIAGVSENNRTDPAFGYPEFHAVLWDNGKIRDLGTLGGTSSFAISMNDGGQIVGPALNSIPDPYSILGNGSLTTLTQTRAFLSQNGKMHDLGTLGGPDSWPFFVNNRGQVAGMSNTSYEADPGSGMPPLDPFLWDNGKMKDLGNFGGTNPFFTGQAGIAGLNNRGQVTGYMTLSGDQTSHSFLWDGTGLIDLGTLGGSYAFAFGLNDSAIVVGASAPPGDQVNHAFRWANGVISDLGVLDEDVCSSAINVNSKGQIVGTSQDTECDAYGRAFLWENGNPIVDLNSLISNNSSQQLRTGVSITDLGEIVVLRAPPGCAKYNDSCLRPSVLIPCDENHPDIKGCDYSPAYVAARFNPGPAQSSQTSGTARAAGSMQAGMLTRLHSMISSRDPWLRRLARTLEQK